MGKSKRLELGMPTLREQNKEIYMCWTAIKQRCNNQNAQAYRNYGGRGITYCDEWEQFKPFCEWALANGWQKGLDIDRIDNDGDYSPDNCRWVTRRENTNNRRITIHLTVNGETKPLTIWEDETGINRATIKRWVRLHGKEYAEERIEEAIKDGFTFADYGRNHKRTPIKNLDTGITYASYYEAAKKLGLNRGNLITAVRKGKPTKCGMFVEAH